MDTDGATHKTELTTIGNQVKSARLDLLKIVKEENFLSLTHTYNVII